MFEYSFILINKLIVFLFSLYFSVSALLTLLFIIKSFKHSKIVRESNKYISWELV
jgi:hypothetical protein